MSRDTRLVWFAFIFSGIAAVCSFLVAGAVLLVTYEARQQTKIAVTEPVADAVIRAFGIERTALMRTGDDLFLIDGAAGDSHYISGTKSGLLGSVVACTNFSIVDFAGPSFQDGSRSIMQVAPGL